MNSVLQRSKSLHTAVHVVQYYRGVGCSPSLLYTLDDMLVIAITPANNFKASSWPRPQYK